MTLLELVNKYLCQINYMHEIHIKVIVNPEAGSRSVGRRWPFISRQLQKAGLSFDYEFTKGRGQATEIARRAIDESYNYLIAVGGDGTVNEVANGILGSSKSRNVLLGVICAGTAHAFACSLHIPEDNNDVNAYSFLNAEKGTLIDVGLVQFWNRGRPLEHFFLNEASVGFSAETVDAWDSLPVLPGNKSNYLLRNIEGYITLIKHRNKVARIQIGDFVESASILTLIVSNGQYCANKMMISPHANLNDGLLNAVVATNMSKYELLKIRPTLYKGQHINHPKVKEIETKFVAVESQEGLLVEADGEILGVCPASFRIIPSALSVVIPA